MYREVDLCVPPLFSGHKSLQPAEAGSAFPLQKQTPARLSRGTVLSIKGVEVELYLFRVAFNLV